MTQETYYLSILKNMKKTFVGGTRGVGWARDGVRKRESSFFIILGPKRSTRFLTEEYEKKNICLGK